MSQFTPNRDTFETRLKSALETDESVQQIVAASNLLEAVQYCLRNGKRIEAYLQLQTVKARIEKVMSELQR